ncbi:MAG: hypothetical protein ACRCXZ_02455 [Patescibacteria group bacterium]
MKRSLLGTRTMGSNRSCDSIGYFRLKILEDQVDFLKKSFRPKWRKIKGPHVTLIYRKRGNNPLVFKDYMNQVGIPYNIPIIGHACNSSLKIETFIVDLSGTGLIVGSRVPHITWSKGPAVKATKSNFILTNDVPNTIIKMFDEPILVSSISDFARI